MQSSQSILRNVGIHYLFSHFPLVFGMSYIAHHPTLIASANNCAISPAKRFYFRVYVHPQIEKL